MMVAALAVVSCAKSEIAPLTGKFPDATEVQYSSVTSEAEIDENDRRIFTLDFTGTTPMHLVLVGNKYFLTANQYTEAIDAVAKNGNFILGESTIGGKNIKQGFVNVELLQEIATEEGCENAYSISTIVFLEDGTPYKTSWKGNLTFEKDPVLAPEFTYTDVVAQDCTLEDGATPVEDVESHTLTITNMAGDFAAQIKLIRKVGTKDLAGTYTVKEYAHEDFSAGNGFDLGTLFGMPAGSYVIGSYYMDGENLVIIEPGATITVAGAGNGLYTIEGDGFSFFTAPEGYVPGGGTVYTFSDTVAADCTLEDGSTAVEGVESHTLLFTEGEETVAQIKLIRATGTTDLVGEYTVKEYAHEDFTAGNGFDLGAAFGMDPGSWVIGTFYYDEEGALKIVEPGETVSVTKSGDVYTFSISTGYKIHGKLAAGGDDPDPQPGEDVVLTGLTIYDTVGAAADSSMQPVAGVEKHTMTMMDGENVVAGMELVIAEGGDLAGAYTCKSYPTEPYLMGNGYDLSFMGMGIGGSYYYSGETLVLINEGETMTLVKNGDGSYTFTGTGYSISGNIVPANE